MIKLFEGPPLLNYTVATHPITSSRASMLKILSGIQMVCLFCCHHKIIPILVDLWKALKMCFFYQPWGSHVQRLYCVYIDIVLMVGCTSPRVIFSEIGSYINLLNKSKSK